MILLFDDQILMVIPNPGDLDPTILKLVSNTIYLAY